MSYKLFNSLGNSNRRRLQKKVARCGGGFQKIIFDLILRIWTRLGFVRMRSRVVSAFRVTKFMLFILIGRPKPHGNDMQIKDDWLSWEEHLHELKWIINLWYYFFKVLLFRSLHLLRNAGKKQAACPDAQPSGFLNQQNRRRVGRRYFPGNRKVYLTAILKH